MRRDDSSCIGMTWRSRFRIESNRRRYLLSRAVSTRLPTQPDQNERNHPVKFKLTILAAFFLGLLAAPALAQNNQATAYQSSALTPYGQGDGEQANHAMVTL